MGDLNVGTSQSNSNYDAGNIVIKHHAHHGIGTSSTDVLSQSQGNYQEEYVPPADYPQLPQFDPNASEQPPQRALDSPNARFAGHLQNNINTMSNAQFAKFQQGNPGITRQQAQNMLNFAWNHPDVPRDPATEEVLGELVQHASQETQEEMGLTTEWTPAEPDTGAANQQIADDYNNNFEQLANRSGSNAAALLFAHNNPEFADLLSPQQQNELSNLEQQADTETRNQNGIPENFEIPQDNSAYNASLGKEYDENFNEAAAGKLFKGEITPREHAQLRTLHEAPGAKVPDRNKLMHLLKELNSEAFAKLNQKFELPANFKLPSSSASMLKMLAAEFQESFADNVKTFNPPLTDAQKQLLLATNGLNKSNLPPALQIIFDNIKNKTVADMQEMFGLPKNWDPKTNKLEGDKEVKEEEPEEASSESEAAWSGVQGSKANPKIRGKRLFSNKVSLQDVGEVAPRDQKLGRQLINHAQEMAGHFAKFNIYLNGPDAIRLGDSMLVVSLALSNLRRLVYEVQEEEAKLAQSNSKAQEDGQISRTKAQHAAILKQRNDKPKEFFLFKIFDALGLSFLITPFKVLMWFIDTLTGGMISAIVKAAGCQPITENPLQAIGILTPAQAQKMDFVCQIIAMVAEMIVSIIIMQPELVMGIIAAMSAEVAGEVGTTVARVALQAALKSVAEGATEVAGKGGTEAGSEAAGTVLKTMAKTTTEAGAKVGVETGAEVASDAVEDVAEDAAKKAVDEALQKILEELQAQGLSPRMLKSIEKTLQKMIPNIVKGAAKQALKSGARTAEDAVEKTTQDIVNDGLENLEKILAKNATKGFKAGARAFGKNIVDVAKGKVSSVKELFKADNDFIQSIGRSAARSARSDISQSVMKYGQWIQIGQDVINGALGTASNIVQGLQDVKQAQLALELAQIEALIDHLGTDLTILQKSMKTLQTAMTDMASWVNDINKQQSQYWQKMQIHFVAA